MCKDNYTSIAAGDPESVRKLIQGDDELSHSTFPGVNIEAVETEYEPYSFYPRY